MTIRCKIQRKEKEIENVCGVPFSSTGCLNSSLLVVLTKFGDAIPNQIIYRFRLTLWRNQSYYLYGCVQMVYGKGKGKGPKCLSHLRDGRKQQSNHGRLYTTKDRLQKVITSLIINVKTRIQRVINGDKLSFHFNPSKTRQLYCQTILILS